MNSSSSTATSTVAESFQSSWPPTGEAGDAQTGGGRRRRSSGALGTIRSSLCWSECPEEEQPAPEKVNCPASRGRSRRTGKPILKAGEAREEEEEAKGSKVYLFPRLSRPPDVSGSRTGRRRSSGRSSGLRALAEIGIFSERPSGAS